MRTRIVHLKRESYDVDITRNGEWGNPFIIGVDGNRARVIDLYRNYLEHNPHVVEKARKQLKGKVLGCWCKPRACHGDVLIEFIHRART